MIGGMTESRQQRRARERAERKGQAPAPAPREYLYLVQLGSSEDDEEPGSVWWHAVGGLARWDEGELLVDSSGEDFEPSESLAEVFGWVADEVARRRRSSNITGVRFENDEGQEWDRAELARLAGVEPPA